MAFHYGLMHLPNQNASVKIGPLMCSGSKPIPTHGTSCESLKAMGQNSGYFITNKKETTDVQKSVHFYLGRIYDIDIVSSFSFSSSLAELSVSYCNMSADDDGGLTQGQIKFQPLVAQVFITRASDSGGLHSNHTTIGYANGTKIEWAMLSNIPEGHYKVFTKNFTIIYYLYRWL